MHLLKNMCAPAPASEKKNPVATFVELNVNISHSNHQEGKKNTRIYDAKNHKMQQT